MTTPGQPDNSAAWAEYMRDHTPTGAPRLAPDGLPPRFGTVPPGLVVDPTCPRCGGADAWKLLQVLGETPGIPDAPAAGGGVVMRCNRCDLEMSYRAAPPGAAEVTRRVEILRDRAPGR